MWRKEGVASRRGKTGKVRSFALLNENNFIELQYALGDGDLYLDKAIPVLWKPVFIFLNLLKLALV